MLGYSIERYAPGVEGVLLQFDQVNGLTTTYLNTAAGSEIGDVDVTTFDATGLLNRPDLHPALHRRPPGGGAVNIRSIGIAVAVMVLLALLFFFLVWSPLSDQQTALEAETTALQDQEQQLRNQLAQLEMIQDNELQIRADLNRLRSLVPPGDPAQPSFVRAAQLAADASGTSISSLTFAQPVPVDGAVADAEGLVLAQIPTPSGGRRRLLPDRRPVPSLRDRGCQGRTS